MDLKEEFLKGLNNGVIRGAQAKLAANLNITQSAVARWFKGIQFPSEEYISAMAKLVNWPEDKVREMFAQNAPDYVHDSTAAEVMLIPVLGTSSATEEKFILEEAETYLPIKKSSAKQFAVRVEGNCMVDPEDPQNSIYHGNYIIVDPDADATNGDVVLARIDEEYSTIKRMFVKGKEVKLIPDNPACTTIIKPVKSVEIIGKVVNVYRPVKKKKERK